MYGVLFVDNFAYNGGGAVALPAFRALKQHNTTSGFCVGCHFDNNTAPYQTKEGFATRTLAFGAQDRIFAFLLFVCLFGSGG